MSLAAYNTLGRSQAEAIALGMLVSIWQGIVLWKVDPREVLAPGTNESH